MLKGRFYVKGNNGDYVDIVKAAQKKAEKTVSAVNAAAVKAYNDPRGALRDGRNFAQKKVSAAYDIAARIAEDPENAIETGKRVAMQKVDSILETLKFYDDDSSEDESEDNLPKFMGSDSPKMICEVSGIKSAFCFKNSYVDFEVYNHLNRNYPVVGFYKDGKRCIGALFESEYADILEEGIKYMLNNDLEGEWVDYYNCRHSLAYEPIAVVRLPDNAFAADGTLQNLSLPKLIFLEMHLSNLLGTDVNCTRKGKNIEFWVKRENKIFCSFYHNEMIDKIRNRMSNGKEFIEYALIDFWGKYIR